VPHLRRVRLLERGLLVIDLLPVTLDEQIAAVRREIAMRERVYPRQVGNGRMTQRLADRELELMRAVLETLTKLSSGGCA
jgi:hypothetical protein